MALVWTIVTAALVGMVLHWTDVPARLRAARFNADLTGVMNRATAELVEEQLSAGPRAVRLRSGRRLQGPFLDIDLDATRLHLRLYHDAVVPPTDDESVVRLTRLTEVEGVGWVAVVDGPRGSQRYLGWLVERVAA
jgi:hypothetical protein